MKQCLENLTGSYSSSAKIVDGTLILSLPDAAVPTVWRLELGETASSALEIREGKNGGFILVLKTAEGTINEIAPFDRRAKAVNALMAASRALSHAHGQLRPASRNLPVPLPGGYAEYAPANRPPARRASWLGRIVGILILLALVLVFINLGPRRAFDISSLQGTASENRASAPANPAGVPVPADEFLRGAR